ncbi:hypothetical protein KIPB_014783, partial [Kipferlia bialata]|eukprot:g14783.t1
MLDTRVSTPTEGVVLGLSGSPRKGGNTDTLLQTILEAATQSGCATHSDRLADLQYQPCVGCEACRRADKCVRFKDGMTGLYPK